MAIEIPFISSAAKFFYAMVTFSSTIEKQTKEMDAMKNNYLNQFKEVRDRINTSEKTILEKMHSNHVEIIDRINAKKK